MRAAEINAHVRFIALPSNRILMALQPWRLLDARAHGQSLALSGVYTGLEGDPLLRTLGPFAATDVESLAASLRERYALPRVLERVSSEELEASPRDYHSRHVEVEGDWESGFECSDFAGAWLEVPSAVSFGRALVRRRVTVRGVFLFEALGGFGHLGGYSSSLVAYSLTLKV